MICSECEQMYQLTVSKKTKVRITKTGTRVDSLSIVITVLLSER